MPFSLGRTPDQNEIECPQCGAIFPYHYSACPNCGRNLYEPEEELEEEKKDIIPPPSPIAHLPAKGFRQYRCWSMSAPEDVTEGSVRTLPQHVFCSWVTSCCVLPHIGNLPIKVILGIPNNYISSTQNRQYYGRVALNLILADFSLEIVPFLYSPLPAIGSSTDSFTRS